MPKDKDLKKLVRARTQLLLNQPFFGALCLRLRLVPDASLPTMATDWRRILYNLVVPRRGIATADGAESSQGVFAIIR